MSFSQKDVENGRQVDTSLPVVIGMLYNALDDAIEGMEEMISYVPEYYANKWDHHDYIERAKTILKIAESSFQ